MAGPTPFSRTLPLTSLGAVGGPTGTAAGVLRVLVDFALNYDGERVQELEADITKLQSLEEKAKNREIQLTKQLTSLEERQEQARTTKAKLVADRQRLAVSMLDKQAFYYEKINNLQKAGANPNVTNGMLGVLQKRINALVKTTGLTEAEIRNYIEQRVVAEQIEGVEARIATRKSQQLRLQEQINALTREASALEQLRAQAGPRLLGLGVGAVGGIFGGALFGAGWAAAQAGIDAVSGALQDMVDPARHARENVEDLASAIEAVASDDKLSNLEKASQYLSSLGPGGEAIRSGNEDIDRLLSLALATDKLNKTQEQLNKTLDHGRHGQDLYEDALQRTGETLIRQSEAYLALNHQIVNYTGVRDTAFNDLERQFRANPFQVTREQLQVLVAMGGEIGTIASNFADARDASEAALRAWSQGQGALDDAAAAASALADELERAMGANLDAAFDQRMDDIAARFQAQADNIRTGAEIAMAAVDRMADQSATRVRDASDARIEQLRNRLENINSGPSARTRRLQDAIGNVGSGESARTRALQAAIDRLNEAQERRAYLTQLAEIREERYLLKLRRTLETSNRAIRIYQYAGKARVVAIEASISRLEKEQQAQDRLNKSLDLQYQASQRIMRQEGESIKDFLDRRAQEYRHQIAERATFEREGRINRLEDLRTEAEYRVNLAENTKKRLDTIRDREQKLHMEALQERLRASQEADRAAAAAQRDRLNKQLEASREADRQAYEAKRRAVQKEIEKEEELRDAKIKAINAAATARKLAIQLERDRQLKVNEQVQKAVEKAEKAKQEAVRRYASKAEADRFKLAVSGARNLAELNLIAGRLAGANGSLGQIQAYVNGLGLSTTESRIILANASAMRAAYQAQFAKLSSSLKPPVGGAAEGAVFALTNAMNFGRNMRVGEEGQELGIVLSHRVADILQRQKSRGPAIGTVNIVSAEDPVQAQYRLRRTIKETQQAGL